MSTRRFAMALGLVLIALGAAGLVPPLVAPAQGGAIAASSGHGLTLGLFPGNGAHHLLHIIIGLWGLVAGRSARAAALYARAAAVVFATLTLMGLVPGPDDLWGALPLYGNNIWLHAGLGATAAYFGWAHRSRS